MRYWKKNMLLAIPIIIVMAVISLAQKACGQTPSERAYLERSMKLVSSSAKNNGLHIIMQNDRAEYTLTCNQRDSTCRTPAANRVYDLIRFTPRFYRNCENVGTITTSPHQGEGIYCLGAVSQVKKKEE